MNNGHFSRQGHNNNRNRNRNRNRRHGGGGHSSHGGGNNGNRVLDSNGPDVKLRGTAQTIAEKYMQLGRDAQLSGDNVMAESYYQHGEHYYRLWLASQPAGQPIQFSRNANEDELEDDQAETAEGDEEANAEPVAERPEGQAAGDEESQAPTGDQQQNRPQRNRDGQQQGGRERFRNNRWPRRNDRNAEGVREGGGEAAERPPQPVENAEAEPGNWETPSFLTRPMPAVTDDGDAPPQGDRKPRREFRPRRPREAQQDTTSETPPETAE